MSKERRAIPVLSDSLDHRANRERRVTGVFPVPQDRLVSKETTVLPARLVHWVPSVPQDYLVPLVPKELKDHLVQLDQRERLVQLDLLDHLDPPATSSSHCPSRVP